MYLLGFYPIYRHRAGERILAAMGALDGAAVRFEPCRHVPFGGVLCALGALSANGLLSRAQQHLNQIGGYYRTVHILLLLVIDSGLLAVLREDIVPRLLREVPGQPGAEELAADPHLCRFVLVYDREGYSPGFLKEMWQNHRIGSITYHKHPIT
jgi:hypothetical protein